MFESIKLSNEKEEGCEECLARAYLIEAIIDGQQKRLCNKCIVANNAIVLKGPKHIEMDIINRPSVRDAIFRASGMHPHPIQPTYREAKLEDLRERYEEVKKKKAEEQAKLMSIVLPKRENPKVLDEKDFINYMKSLPPEQTKSQTTSQTSQTPSSQISPSIQPPQPIQPTPPIQPIQPLSPSSPSPQPISPKPVQPEKGGGKKILDFSIEGARRTRIRDLLESMQKKDDDADAQNLEKEKKREEKV